MVSRRSGYEDNWDAFLLKIKKFSRNQVRAMREEATIDQKLSMVHALARDWVEVYSREDAIDRLQQAQRRMAEDRRMQMDSNARRDYLDSATRAMLPPVRIQRPIRRERQKYQAAGRAFWEGMERGRWRRQSIEQIAAGCRGGGRTWAAAHPYGPTVEPERLIALRNDFRRWRDGHVRVTREDAVRLLTPQKHQEIAHMLATRG